MNRAQQGFTLIELVMVIVIIGILAAIALPKFTDLSGEANQAAVNGVAGALASASAVNYAARKAGSTATTTSAINNCPAVATVLQGGALPAGYDITPKAATTTFLPDVTQTCTVTHTTSTKTATFSAIGVG